MLLLRVAPMTTMWAKAEHRDPLRKEPLFRAGDRMTTRAPGADRVSTVPERVGAADILVAEEDGETQLIPLVFQPRNVERRWALFGLRFGAESELWLRAGGISFAAFRGEPSTVWPCVQEMSNCVRTCYE